MSYLTAFVVPAIAFATAGCMSNLTYMAPKPRPPVQNSKLVDKTFEEAWAAAIPKIGSNFFVINNLDKSSGFINFSYSGDPANYIDCGLITVPEFGANPGMTYRGEVKSIQHLVPNPAPMGTPLLTIRTMALDGRVALVLQPENDKTRVTMTTQYVVTREAQFRAPGGPILGMQRTTATFKSGQLGTFPPNAQGETTSCYPTGRLEADVLQLIN